MSFIMQMIMILNFYSLMLLLHQILKVKHTMNISG